MEICAYMLTIDGIYGKDSDDRRSHFTQTKPNQCVTSGHSGSDKVRPSNYDVVRRRSSSSSSKRAGKNSTIDQE